MIRLLAALILSLGLAGAVAAQMQVESGLGAVLRGLDKVNGETIDVEIPWGGTVNVFGLGVTVSDCRYPPENPTGDAYALLSITDRVSGFEVFHGWMIASAPALNPLDHNRYDVWVLRCITS